ncbi:MAG: hypothetical protein ACYS8W_10560 [Planctomycetota bacterium]|jgi:hypothetical protein
MIRKRKAKLEDKPGSRRGANEDRQLNQLREKRESLFDELRKIDTEIRKIEQLPEGSTDEPLSFDEVLPGFDDHMTAAAFEFCRHLLFSHAERLKEQVETKKGDDFGYKLANRWFMLLKFSRYYFDLWVNPKFKLHERLPEEIRIELNLRRSKNRGWEGVRLHNLDQVKRMAPYLEKNTDN